MALSVLVLNGPNLNLLGVRDPQLYGSETLAQIQSRVEIAAQDLGITVDFRQSNSEAELIDWIQAARETADGIVLNAAAYTHSSPAIADAVEAAGVPMVEVHLTNVFARERFRHRSYLSRVAVGVICGFGADGYVLALRAVAAMPVRR